MAFNYHHKIASSIFPLALVFFLCQSLVPGICQSEIEVTPNLNRYHRQTILSEHLCITSIDSSKADIEIRLFASGFSKEETLVILKYKHNYWQSVQYKIIWTDHIFRDDIQVKDIHKTINSKIENPSFLDSLIFYNFFSLPDMQEIKHKLRKEVSEDKIIKTVNNAGDTVIHVEYGKYLYISSVDGVSYFIEIKVGEKIRGYGYYNPEIYLKEFPEVAELQDFEKILLIIEQII